MSTPVSTIGVKVVVYPLVAGIVYVYGAMYSAAVSTGVISSRGLLIGILGGSSQVSDGFVLPYRRGQFSLYLTVYTIGPTVLVHSEFHSARRSPSCFRGISHLELISSHGALLLNVVLFRSDRSILISATPLAKTDPVLTVVP